jgi:hypothetical protein
MYQIKLLKDKYFDIEQTKKFLLSINLLTNK